MPVVILIVVIIALVIIVNCVKIVPQAHAVAVSYTHLTLPTKLEV